MSMTSSVLLGPSSLLTAMTALTTAVWAAAPKTVEPPPNAPATAEWKARQGRLSLRYHGTVILDATVRAQDAAGRPVAGVEVKLEPTETLGEKVEQRTRFTWKSRGMPCSSRYSVNPCRYGPFTNLSASGQFGNFMFTASHSSFWFMRMAMFPSRTTSARWAA